MLPQTLLTDVSLAKPLRLGISTSSVEGKSSNIMEIAYSARPVSVSYTTLKQIAIDKQI